MLRKLRRFCREPGIRAMPMDVRKNWSRFLTASIARTPFAIKGWRAEFRKMGERKLEEGIALIDDLMPNWFDDAGLEQIIDFLSSDKAVDTWMNMQWFVERTEGAAYDLLTSDWPWVGRYIEGSESRMLLFPLTPKRLFCQRMIHLLLIYSLQGRETSA